MMENTSIAIDRRVLPDRRILKDRRSFAENTKIVQQSQTKKHNLVLGILGSIVALVIGMAIYKATGLYNAVESNIWHVGLGGAIVYYCVIAFRLGFYSE
ncbi:MAG: hypothetical protein KAQ85_09485 [Thermodesulfovibrionia bacterium]|nr:hypothetical protein [Thermodesulfovibrionia bacterium]MCK5426640.1 hypothetical protein [Thermodesulfovibrionia bacterium]